MSIEKLYKKLIKDGYTCDLRTLYNVAGTGKDTPVIVVKHDYDGEYPPKDVLNMHASVTQYARKKGFDAVQRGHYTATFIF